MGRLFFYLALFTSFCPPLWGAPPLGDAPPTGMLPGFWSTAIKQGFGTAYESYDGFGQFSSNSDTAPLSKVWFTIAQGAITEVYWPSVDVAQIRDSQFLVTDGKKLFFEERQDGVSSVSWLMPSVPAFRIVNQDPGGKFSIEKTVFVDPDRNALILRVVFKRNSEGLRLHLLHNPHVGNSPMGDTAKVQLSPSSPEGMFASHGDHAQAVLISVPIRQATAGFEGTISDGFQDLRKDFKLDSHYEWAKNGNTVLTAWLDLPQNRGSTSFDIIIGFGRSVEEAAEVASKTLKEDLSEKLTKYSAQWKKYQGELLDLSLGATDGGKLFRSSIALLKSMEDKTNSGGFVASPTVPWGQHISDSSSEPFQSKPLSPRKFVTGYHVVWPRDLYHIATAFLAVGDVKTARASLDYFKMIQLSASDGDWNFGFRKRSKEGTFPQNCWVDGQVNWTGLQMDEVAVPILLAERLGRLGHIKWADYWNLVRGAADFIEAFGPWSPQERWEENFGASPSTLSAEIAALKGASIFAKRVNDTARAARYQNTADSWASKPNDNIDTWTFSSSGIHGNGRYYLRLEGASSWDQVWNPNDDMMFALANHAGYWREKDVTDAGFLELVRLGVRKATHPLIEDSLSEIDSTIRVSLPGGPGFRRYLGDRYNYDDLTNAQTPGMPWPILTGERGHYELARAVENKLSSGEIDLLIKPYVVAMESFSTEQQMIPEQIWDGGARVGKSTGSATPLGWAHAEYIKLLRSRMDQKVFDLVASP